MANTYFVGEPIKSVSGGNTSYTIPEDGSVTWYDSEGTALLTLTGAGAMTARTVTDSELNLLHGVTSTTAELNLVDDQIASFSLTPTAAAANVCEVAITAKDAAGATIARPWIGEVWLSDAASGAGLTREAFRFTGWNTAADGSGTTVTSTTTSASLAAGGAHTVTLYAQWTPTVPAWQAATVYTSGDIVYYQGMAYQAQWWTRGEVPGSSPYGAWAQIGVHSQCASGPVQQWTASWVYTEGATVEHGGKVWTAQWWTRNQEPGASPYGPWKLVGGC